MKNQIARLTQSDLATIYGCCGLFDVCGDADLMSLSFEGTSKFLDWIGWERTDVCLIKKYFITWNRPEYSQGSPTGGYVADPCADGNGVEWGECDFVIDDFGRLRRVSPVRDITRTTGLRYCEAQPRYRLDGSAINDDREYDMRVVTEVLLQDLKRMVINGNAVTGGHFDGLEQLVVTGYTDSQGRRCAMMDSIVIDWKENNMDGTGGNGNPTWNGVAFNGYNFIDTMLAAYRQIRQRISWSPPLAAQGLRVGDIVIVAPTQLIRCILDAYTCWSVCPGQQYNEANINTLDARDFRNNLLGGMFGDGRIFLDGFEIPLVAYDWGLIGGPTRFDAYMLLGQAGNVKTLMGQYLDMNMAANKKASDGYVSTDGGRLLTWATDDHTCEQRSVEMQPRLVSWTPWANVRFQDIVCRQPNMPLSPDPTESSFFPETSFFVAECP